MKSEWKQTTLGEVVRINTSSITKGCSLDEILYLDTGSVTKGKIDQLQKMNIGDAPSRARRIVKHNDIVYSTVRPVQEHYALLKNPEENLIASTGFAVMSAQDNSNPEFIYYLLTQKSVTNLMQQIAEHSTSTYPSIKPEHLAGLEIWIPPLEEQKSIAAVLSSLDDKIKLLRAQNKTLEEMAQRLFKEWFVDFNFPNEDGKPYKKSGGRMVESEMGEIPEGWRVGSISDLASHEKITVKPQEEPDNSFIHYSIPAFDAGRSPEHVFGREIKSNKYKVVSKSFLVSKLNPVTPRTWMIFKAPENGVCSTEFQVIRPTSDENFALVFSILNSQDLRDTLAAKAHGTSGSHQRVRPEDITGSSIAVAPMDRIKMYSEACVSLLDMLNLSSMQIQNLSDMRDTLLPKLMSGELKLSIV